MDVLFENRLIRNKDVFKAFYQYLYFKKPFPIVMFCICGIIVTRYLLRLLFLQYFVFDILVIYPIVYIPLLLIAYSVAVNTSVKRDIEQFGTSALLITTSFKNDSLCCTYGEVQTAPVMLDQIKKVVTTKKLILIFSKAKLCYILDKDNFTIGKLNDFIDFLRNKGLKVKG